ncbi:Serine/threonine-protein kinase crk1 [Nosema bombycis CQ1]|uniref:[RNA-polymerase]-subunit kinase n=1 Tax=Nosema bombycis (strain CQ1 / CVCC 102059) TaxID=578461 RepID=R0ML85_NOSB1|nr:Serine/threonine-protein kinase crk1 [Nosema bombycis CQ1]|eukprot:EOB14990.1 Serine/threonine-protein kinase crk1 [Nosema bombycis CQ1]
MYSPSHSYIKRKKLGEGTYATVYQATPIQKQDSIFIEDTSSSSSSSSHFVAIKQCKKNLHNLGHDISAFREIKSLKRIRSNFVINLRDVFIYKKDIHLVLDYYETDLETIIRNKEVVILPSDIKSWLKMILTGLHHIHSLFIIPQGFKTK